MLFCSPKSKNFQWMMQEISRAQRQETNRCCLVPLVFRDCQFLSHIHFRVVMAETYHYHLQGIFRFLLDSFLLSRRGPFGNVSGCAIPRTAAISGSFDRQIRRNAEWEGKCSRSTALDEQREGCQVLNIESRSCR